MLMNINYEISFVLLALLDPLEVSVKQEEEIWCLNMKSIELKSPATKFYTMSSGCMDLCAFFGIQDTARALANCWHPSFFSTLMISLYSVPI